jgi:hypothetical protein
MGSITAGQMDGAAASRRTPGRLSARRLPIWIRVSAVVVLVLAGIVALAMVLGAEGVGSTGGHGSGGGHGSTDQMEMREDAPAGNHGAGREGARDHGPSGRGASQSDHRSESDRSPGGSGSDHGSR